MPLVENHTAAKKADDGEDGGNTSGDKKING